MPSRVRVIRRYQKRKQNQFHNKYVKKNGRPRPLRDELYKMTNYDTILP